MSYSLGLQRGGRQGVEPLLLLPAVLHRLRVVVVNRASQRQWMGNRGTPPHPPIILLSDEGQPLTFLLEGVGGSGRRTLKQNSVVPTRDGS